MKQLLVVGGGFAGVWAAMTAAQERERIAGQEKLAISLVSRDPWLTIRPRLYEASLDDVRVPIDEVLGPLGVRRIEAEVTAIDSPARTVTIRRDRRLEHHSYDRLILAAGSRTIRPALPGIEHAFGVDSFQEAAALDRHLASLATRPDMPDSTRFTAAVIGAGFTGIEVATTLVTRLRQRAAEAGLRDAPVRVVLVDRAGSVAPDMGENARASVERALAELDIQVRVGGAVTSIGRDGVAFGHAEFIPASTVVWTGGFHASPLATLVSPRVDGDGRLPVDEFLRVAGVPGVYAAGDVARVVLDGDHVAPMSCQYAIPMGEAAGRNAVADLFERRLAAFAPAPYVTCLDLGHAGALFTHGWDRAIALEGYWASVMKRTINRELIYPPRPTAGTSGTRRAA